MKKLTAGILASLIGLVSANSAEAAVASTKYVDEGLATKQQKLTTDNFKTDGVGQFVTGINIDANGNVTFTSANQAEVAVDDALKQDSTNPVQNKVIAEKIAEMALTTDGQSGVIKTVKQTAGKVEVTSGTVAEADIADNAVTSAKIANGTIVTDDIADNAVTSAKIVSVTMDQVTDLGTTLAGKQAKLTEANQGTNVDLTFDAQGNLTTISATDTTYTAGAGIKLNGTEFSADVTTAVLNEGLAGKQNKLTTANQGDNVQLTFDEQGNLSKISATDTTYTAANGIELDGTTFKAKAGDGITIDEKGISADITQEEFDDALGTKQGNLTAGNGITLDEAGNIAAKAGTGITIDANGISANNQLDAVKEGVANGADGAQVLTRNCDAQGVCSYVWEDIDRTFGK